MDKAEKKFEKKRSSPTYFWNRPITISGIVDFIKRNIGWILLICLFSSILFFTSNTGQNQEVKTNQPPSVEEQHEASSPKDSESEPPLLKGAKRTNFSWELDGREYEVEIELYKSLYDRYSAKPKKYTCSNDCPSNWKEEYYNNFLTVFEEDETFAKLSSKIESVGDKSGFEDDQNLDLVVAFVQSIPYDESINPMDSVLPRYPYEVLYEKKGVCSGKSLLGALLAKELGYGAALFVYEEANHMALGIKCPQEYSSYSSGYCFIELTTPGWKIGIEDFKDIDGIQSTEKTPSLVRAPDIYEVAEGKEYKRVPYNLQKKKEVEDLEQAIERKEEEIRKLSETLDYYKSIEDYSAYNDLVPVYNDLVSSRQADIERYNTLIEELTPGM